MSKQLLTALLSHTRGQPRATVEEVLAMARSLPRVPPPTPGKFQEGTYTGLHALPTSALMARYPANIAGTLAQRLVVIPDLLLWAGEGEDMGYPIEPLLSDPLTVLETCPEFGRLIAAMDVFRGGREHNVTAVSQWLEGELRWALPLRHTLREAGFRGTVEWHDQEEEKHVLRLSLGKESHLLGVFTDASDPANLFLKMADAILWKT